MQRISILGGIGAALWALSRARRSRALVEFILRSFSVQARILWSTAQILYQYLSLLRLTTPSGLSAAFSHLGLVSFSLLASFPGLEPGPGLKASGAGSTQARVLAPQEIANRR